MKTVISLLLAVVLSLGCNVQKQRTTTKTDSTAKQGSSTVITGGSSYMYIDTGSTVIYYRDSLIFRNDTVYQAVDKIVTRNGKTVVIRDTITIVKRDTITVTVERKVKNTNKQKQASSLLWLLPFLIGSIGTYFVMKYSKTNEQPNTNQ